MEKQIICIQCPVGCSVTVKHDGQNIKGISGNKCSKGKFYVQSEFICSNRVLTSTVLCKTEKGILPLPVKTDGEIPLHLLRDAVTQLRKNTYTAPVKTGDKICSDILGTGIDVVATKDLL
ncbi:MAG TPA: molybdopterin oxidoreductase [Clostridiales bacterium]|nr:molybdopterin oxidoreductase [Clostridiales bacterium]